jgi:hypothetical protein
LHYVLRRRRLGGHTAAAQRAFDRTGNLLPWRRSETRIRIGSYPRRASRKTMIVAYSGSDNSPQRYASVHGPPLRTSP